MRFKPGQIKGKRLKDTFRTAQLLDVKSIHVNDDLSLWIFVADLYVIHSIHNLGLTLANVYVDLEQESTTFFLRFQYSHHPLLKCNLGSFNHLWTLFHKLIHIEFPQLRYPN